MKIIITLCFITIVSIQSLKLRSNLFLNSKEDYDNEKVIVNANGQEAPLIPDAAGIGGEGKLSLT